MLSPPFDAPRLTGFKLVRPAHQVTQSDSIAWLAHAHAEAESARSEDETFDVERFRARLESLLRRVGCTPKDIGARGHEVPDCAHRRWDEMRIYDVTRRPNGAGARARTELFAQIAESAIERLYAEESDPPRDLIHVTCTGYASPSAAQKLVASRGWGAHTRVTHAYHMGCYAALPAIRIASGFVASTTDRAARADIVHSEVCSLHLHPAEHSPEQLAVQTLFGDGHIRYSVVRDSPAPSFAVLATREEIFPDSAEAIAWIAADNGMLMTLARDVPKRIARTVRAFVSALYASAALRCSSLSAGPATAQCGSAVAASRARSIQLRPIAARMLAAPAVRTSACVAGSGPGASAPSSASMR
ncbi:MAG: hypothetical protein ABIP39_12560, partial [Polyangiaceae bacterium]